MTGRLGWTTLGVALVVVGLFGAGCDAEGPAAADHKVYFVGNVYDGATGARLDGTTLTSVTITYRDKTIKAAIDGDGRFVTKDALPTWQDYTVTIEATGYRAFVSRNLGFEVPASLAAMNTGLAEISTTQSFAFDAYVFPASLAAPATTLSVNLVDEATGSPLAGKAAGTVRFRPTTVSTLQVGAKDNTAGTPRASRRVWANDEDLLAQTVSNTFKDGKIEIAKGALSYGVTYEVSIYDVPGYAPYVTDGTAQNPNLVAGAVTSHTISLTRAARDPLKILMSSATTCVPPLPTATDFGAQIQLTFSEDVEFVGTTTAEDVDNGVITQTVAATTGLTCPAKPVNADPTKAERGAKVEIAGAKMTFSFNPSMAFVDTLGGTPCVLPSAILSVTYGNLSFFVQPKGDPSRKVALSALLQQLNPAAVSTALVCPSRS